MIVVRVVIVVLILALVAVALVPLVVLLDLVGGGDGYGVCPEGLGSCRTSYFDGPELIAMLVLVMFGLMLVLRLAVLLFRRLDNVRRRAMANPVGMPR